jgi:hypothetical protein
MNTLPAANGLIVVERAALKLEGRRIKNNPDKF